MTPEQGEWLSEQKHGLQIRRSTVNSEHGISMGWWGGKPQEKFRTALKPLRMLSLPAGLEQRLCGREDLCQSGIAGNGHSIVESKLPQRETKQCHC